MKLPGNVHNRKRSNERVKGFLFFSLSKRKLKTKERIARKGDRQGSKRPQFAAAKKRGRLYYVSDKKQRPKLKVDIKELVGGPGGRTGRGKMLLRVQGSRQ